ncbi:hypothetical protein Gohar_026177 [Gossypium harknessii]|uniref:RNase H type-1 domain-containing protein n=1 Tax=Gossypium harknessii TaxID=34285 RepID=A0A7J9HRE2_9ROSI|nr:hypothetical protein [Gossypium harknessii]
MGWAAIVRNDRGDFVHCISGSTKSNLDTFMAEILAAPEAFSWLRSLHVDDIV